MASELKEDVLRAAQVNASVSGDVISTRTRTMSEPFVARVGGILSADIAVPEHEHEVRFYSRVLGTGE